MPKNRTPLTPEEKAALPYRPCVGAIVVNADGLVWGGRRLPNEEYPPDQRLWQFPQGGIDAGEDAAKAALRELYEETSIRSVSPLVEIEGWLTYDLPEHLIGHALKGKYRGQKQRWFVLRFDGDDKEINIVDPPDDHDAEFDQWAWLPIEDMPAKAVAFKADLYRELISRLHGHDALHWR